MQTFLKYLEEYNHNIQPVIDKFFSDQKKEVIKIAPIAGAMIDDFKDFLEGGKKLRGCEVLLGYEMFGGKDHKTGLLASLVIEIIHASLLIHDDFMDQDDLRRGKPTMHKKYSAHISGVDKDTLDMELKDRMNHYGASMAINIGDEGLFLASYLLNNLNLPRDRLSKATQFLSLFLMETGIGQALDISYKKKIFSEEDVLRVHRYKTAEYTISGPISLGAILAGADEKSLKAIKDFGIPIGIAFQLRDDELGMFSTEEELGKPVDSDIRESKVTILIVKAFENAKGEDLKFLKYAFGNQNLSEKDMERVRKIIRSSSSLDYSKRLSGKYVDDGKKFIPKLTLDPKYQNLLSELADFATVRKN
ncbi:hypothetical protein A3F00_02645 [Candidatus Daviesbacteria bacterium RIFCSPHIGHO2_12_FULL_37_11]|uniref:Polyprenyl synthetase n=1 Tax=Candidatus Daviesbacteria bacterium RIFCSPHIGHO2_12_FULL_37_11 TaxID=1797777 RepID=A0A1F5KEQ0_9BACT|nr:MAG: hypothetical protein A2769_02470 [Candidatus Daviesbacteria bacterium RIFCSPHIGHO2_01_FULL_37_27]OGE39334.1 MAG: hypothetical protein A3F00_02645 [Candidatus Daviesbacteria bacterium RIFCSPHIGHO2_12_FULL_37_11]OGE45130.1 MAG: hypothetical protein A3B39_01815 [Candidatus Daviesbacteria bacterium RIFCSPLOWO2_01_FULL_37_10]